MMLLKKLLLSLLVVILAFLSLPLFKTAAVNAESLKLPTLDEFATELKSAKGLAGLYSAGVFALRVVRQPTGNPGYVAPQEGVVTEFALAQQYNTTGLLAHNTMAGADFDQLIIGQTLTLVYANGDRKTYQVSAIERYQALSPNDTRSNFISLNNTKLQLTAAELFNRVYAPGNRLVLQTCIARLGNPTWGRLFIIALPVTRMLLPVSTYDSMPSWYLGSGLFAR